MSEKGEPVPEPTRRAATPEDRDFIYRTKSEALKAYAIATWGPWDETRQRQQFDDKFDSQRFEIVLVGAEPVGFLQTADEGDCLRVHNIALTAPWRNRGIGSALLRALGRQAARPIRLRVLKTNPARRFYERLGFSVVGDPDGHWWEMLREP